MNYNSVKNQAIKRKLVEREVLCQLNHEVEFILSHGEGIPDVPYTWDDVTNQYYASMDELTDYIDYELSEEDKSELLDAFPDADSIEDIDREELQEYMEELHDFEPSLPEIFEWWKVTSWFCEKLTEKGQPTIENYNLWGRCTSGQAILLDHVIGEIAEDMEILEGQRYEWETDS